MSVRWRRWPLGVPALLAAILPQLAIGAGAAASEIPSPALDAVEPRVRAAVEAARREVAAAPADAGAWGRYGMVLDAHRLPVEAALAYEEAARLAPGEMRWPYYLATLYEYSHPARATKYYGLAIALDPDYAPVHVRYGQTLENLGRDDEASAEYRRATEIDSSDALGWLGLGRIALARGEMAAAIAHLERAYGLAPTIQSVVATLARAYQRAGRTELARERGEQARRLPRMTHHRDPLRSEMLDLAVDTESRLHRARIYLEVGQLDRARAEVADLLELEPDQAAAWLLLASIEDQRERPESALEAARRALRLDPDLDGARAVFAGALFKLGRFAEADTEARRVLAAEPDNVHALLLVSLEALRRADFAAMAVSLDRAFAARTRAARLDPLLAQLLADLGAAHAQGGDLSAAARRAAQALTVATESGAPAATVASYRAQLDDYRRGRVSP
jgi:tetratricopeptide (TPR) repeat protein